MEGLLTGRIALVTGAGSGIGEGIAQAMAKAGARIIAVDIDGVAAKRTAEAIDGTTTHHACDVTDPAPCDTPPGGVRRQVGPASVPLNNAALLPPPHRHTPH